MRTDKDIRDLQNSDYNIINSSKNAYGVTGAPKTAKISTRTTLAQK